MARARRVTALRGQTFLGTIAQALPRAGTVIANMTPTWHMKSLDELDDPFLEANDVGALIWDVDGTLTPHHGVLSPAAAAFDRLRRRASLRHAILSNADERRFRELSVIFPGIPIIRGYEGREGTYFRCLVDGVDSWRGAQHAVADGDMVLRKPSAPLVHEAIRVLGVEARRAVMVGDQYLTDIAGAGMAGIRSIKVPTLHRGSFPRPVAIGQVVESTLYRVLPVAVRRPAPRAR